MSRKCIIEKYLHKARFCGDKTIEVPYNDLTMMCHLALDSLHTSRWIPVSERLPENTIFYAKDVLVYCKSGYIASVSPLTCLRWIDEEDFVTHWMPLPEPPGVK